MMGARELSSVSMFFYIRFSLNLVESRSNLCNIYLVWMNLIESRTSLKFLKFCLGRDWEKRHPPNAARTKTRPPNVRFGAVWGTVWGTRLEML
jgi:hypothetical protein